MYGARFSCTEAVVLTDQEGFRSSDDAGASWRELNHGEVAFRNGQRISAVARERRPPSMCWSIRMTYSKPIRCTGTSGGHGSSAFA